MRSFLRALFRRARLEDEMQIEMTSHIEAYADDLVARGVPREEARRQARVEFGGVNVAKEECRESVGLRWPSQLARDMRYAVRILRKSPAFTITAVVTLALCIGANTAIFSVVDWMLLRPLPYPEADRLAAIATISRGKGEVYEQYSVDGRTLELLRDAPALDFASFADIGLGVNLGNGNHAEYVQAQRVSTGFFRVLGVHPAIGREFTPAEDREGGPSVAVLSYHLWKRLFNADPAAIGRSINVRGEAHTIVGAMPTFQPLVDVDLWSPLRPSKTGEGGGTNYEVIARVRPGATWAQANAQMKRVGAAAAKERQLEPGSTMEMQAVPVQRELTEDTRTPLLVLWAAVIVVLVIGCVNIAGLLLVRGAARRREIGTRMALGSGRAAVMRQLLSETVVLAMVGGAAGILLGRLGLNGLKILAGANFGLANVSLDGRVLLLSACASVLTGVLFGLVPAIQASRVDLRTALVESGARSVAGGGRQWTRRGLVVVEVALGVVLLVVAGLLIRSFAHMRALEPGFDSRNVLTATVSLQDARYRTATSVNRLYDESVARIRELPGVQAAGVALTLPYERPLNNNLDILDGAQAGKQCFTHMTYVTPGYFDALRIRLLRGRTLTAADTPTSRPVAVVNESFVRKYFGGQDPVGRHLSGRREIVGVIGDVQQSLEFGGHGPLVTAPGVFITASQMDDKAFQLLHTWFAPAWIVRTTGKQDAVVAGIQQAVESVDPQLPIASFRNMDEVIFRSMTDQRFQAVLLGALAALALLLAAVGIYGLIANSVVERTRELGIRMALGASAGQAMRAVAVPGIALALVGVGIGCMLARGSVKVVDNLVSGVRATDPLTFVLASAVLLLAAVVATIIQALRVTRLNPAETLRAE